jgi:hypothetical protein
MLDVNLLTYATLVPSLALAVAGAWIIRQRVADRALAANVATLFSARMRGCIEPRDPAALLAPAE